METISVIIPVYKAEKFLPKCLDSVLSQTYKDLEIILIDDGSPDNCPKICDEYACKDKRIKVIHQKNQGVSVARNAGLKVATGKYIGFVDGDDYIELDMYEYLYNLISKDEASLSMCNTCQDEGYYTSRPIKQSYIFTKIHNIFEIPDYVYIWNKLYKRDLIGDLKFDTHVSCGEDGFFIFELAKRDVMVALGCAQKYHYRWQQNTNSLTYNFKSSHINKVILEEDCLAYAKQHNWTAYYQLRSVTQLRHCTEWLQQIARADISDPDSVKFLTKYIKQHFKLFLSTRTLSLQQKMFVLCCFVNFNLAAKIIKAYYKVNSKYQS